MLHLVQSKAIGNRVSNVLTVSLNSPEFGLRSGGEQQIQLNASAWPRRERVRIPKCKKCKQAGATTETKSGADSGTRCSAAFRFPPRSPFRSPRELSLAGLVFDSRLSESDFHSGSTAGWRYVVLRSFSFRSKNVFSRWDGTLPRLCSSVLKWKATGKAFHMAMQPVPGDQAR